ncbi:fibroblast growth factor receptor-like 1 isoform X2 [Helicoverpa armigera]|uniref:fibroblast growth factor receptor-like 1 isoform X2 n=1 Tax=Helicoverpa armigera TaxID=29058 RepID=UPI002111ACAC|nr:fibroblast growth factor receptor-like 1 isoform X2 [Helicoverpa armigera]
MSGRQSGAGDHESTMSSVRVTMTTNMLLSLLLHCFCVATTASIPGGGLPGVSGGDGTRPERPYFDDVSPRNVSAVVGAAAVLRCRAKHIGNRTVSWMRKRDLHILTSHIFTYTGDARFSVLHPEPSDDWDLKIDYVQPRDAGVYECQINTEPKINMAVILTVEGSVSLVAAAAATIWGSQDVYVKKGSTISLTCSVNVHSSPPSTASILWYHGNSVVDFDSPRGGISLETEKTEGGTTSKLLVTKAALTDSGNYTCVPNNAHPASVSVHVLNGEHPAAMQTSNRASSYLTSQLSCAIVTYLLSSAVCR